MWLCSYIATGNSAGVIIGTSSPGRRLSHRISKECMNEMNGKLDDDEDNGNLTKPHRLPRSHHVKNSAAREQLIPFPSSLCCHYLVQPSVPAVAVDRRAVRLTLSKQE